MMDRTRNMSKQTRRHFLFGRSTHKEEKPLSPLRSKVHEIIYEADTPAGKVFDVLLLLAILLFRHGLQRRCQIRHFEVLRASALKLIEQV